MSPTKRKPRGLQPHAWVITQVLRRFLQTLGKWIFNITVINREVIPRKGRVILACNHLSIADPVILWGAVRRRRAIAVAMAELWRIPGINFVLWLLGHIPIKRRDRESGKRATAAAIRVLEHDGVLFIYPEGKCSETGELLPFKRGVEDIARATGAIVIPVRITDSDILKPLNNWVLRPRTPVTLAFGEPIDPTDYPEDGQILEVLRDRILALG